MFCLNQKPTQNEQLKKFEIANSIAAFYRWALQMSCGHTLQVYTLYVCIYSVHDILRSNGTWSAL